MIKRNTSQICLWVGMVLMLAVSAKASTLVQERGPEPEISTSPDRSYGNLAAQWQGAGGGLSMAELFRSKTNAMPWMLLLLE